MTINGSTNNSGWTYKLEVTETATSVQNRTSTVQVKAYLGRANSQSYLGGGYSVSVNCAGQTSSQSGTIAYPTYINGGAWLELKTFTFTVSNTGNPTIINISSSMSSGDFTPSYASASGTMQLTILHLPPEISDVSSTELNTQLTNFGVINELVHNLSEKKYTITATANDSATITTYNVYNNNVLIGTSNTNEVTVNFSNITLGNDGVLRFEVIDDMQGKTFKEYLYPQIVYTKPNLEKTTTAIKRKSGTYSSTLGRNANLTDNIADLLLSGTIYKSNDIIGNNNSITSAGYKVWERGIQED